MKYNKFIIFFFTLWGEIQWINSSQDSNLNKGEGERGEIDADLENTH